MHRKLTLREAQKFSLKVFREIENSKIFGKNMWNPFVILVNLLEEAGEVAAAVKGIEGYKPPNKPKKRETLAVELSDMLYSIFLLAEYYEIDLQEAFEKTVNSYLKRFINHK